jgi:hypothetical protein
MQDDISGAWERNIENMVLSACVFIARNREKDSEYYCVCRSRSPLPEVWLQSEAETNRSLSLLNLRSLVIAGKTCSF